jgi:chaperonin GroEL
LDTVYKTLDITVATNTKLGLVKGTNDFSENFGTITVEEGNGTDTTLQVTSGMQFDRGYLSPLFLTDDNSTEVVLENPYILFMDKKLTTLRSCVNLLQAVQQTQRPLLVIAESVEGEALSTMVINHMRGVLRCCAVMAPGFGDRRKAMLKDMAIMTGGTYFAEELGIDLNSVTPDDLGNARKVIITKDTTTIIDGSGVESDIEDRVAHIRNEIENATSEYDRDKLKERLARLRGGIAVIRVGATTETEMKEKKDRIDDALHAARAAVEEGIVPGGGTALLKVRKSINRVIFANGVHSDYLTGRQIVFEAVSATIKQIVANAGGNAELIAAKVEEEPNPHVGYNVVTSSYQNMIEAGVVDPTKVVRTSLLNAASIAGLMLTTECIITEDKQHKESPMPGMSMSM